jgi:hypothetical protein
VGAVTPDDWAALQEQLRATYRRVSASLRGVEDWNDQDRMGAALAMVIHTASHLGAIRQGVRSLG